MKNQNDRMTTDEKEYYSLNKRVWATLAPFYDIIVLPISGIRDKVVTFTNVRMGSRILDVATGTGKQAFAFARRGYDVIGIDLSEAMIKVAAKKNKHANVKLQVADATNLPFADESFDVACVSFALHEMPLTIMKRVLTEMTRVTKPQGIIVVVDYGLPKNRVGRFLVYHFVRVYEGKGYSRFIKSDLGTLFREAKIEIGEELPALFGAVRILRGMRMHNDC